MVWIPANQAAELLCVTYYAIHKAAQQSKYQYRYVSGVGRGGRQLEVLLESLPQSAQDKYHGIEQEKQKSKYMSLTAQQRKTVDFKRIRVQEYKDFKEVYPGADKMCAFLERYNTEHSDNPLTRRQLNHWETKFDRDGINGLIDQRGRPNKNQSSVPDEAWKVFFKLWAKESKPSAQLCYEMTVEYFPDLELPSISSFMRKLSKVDKPTKTRYRDGKKAYQDKYDPYIPTDYSAMHSNQQWVADHHIFDVSVEDEHGDIFRPWLSGWVDRKSRFIVGFAVNKASPNADIVLDSFGRAVKQCGIPEGVLLDNGKDFKAFDIFNQDYPLSLCNEMGIKVRNAIPRNAKAKPIERNFRTLEGYCKQLDSYIGGKPGDRPEKMNTTNAKLHGKVMKYKDFCEFVPNMISAYNNHSHSSLDGKTPKQVYEESFTIPMRVVANDAVLAMFLMRTSKPITVGRNGIRVPALGYTYEDNQLFPYQGRKVFARYNINDVRKIYVFDEADMFICMATSMALSVHDSPVTAETIRENARKKKARNKYIRDQLSDVSVPTVQEHTAKKAKTGAGTGRNIIQMYPVKHKQAAAIKDEERRQKEKAHPPDQRKAAVGEIDSKMIDEALNKRFLKNFKGG